MYMLNDLSLEMHRVESANRRSHLPAPTTRLRAHRRAWWRRTRRGGRNVVLEEAGTEK